MATKEKWRTKAARMREEARETGKVILRAPALVRTAECTIRFLLGALLSGAEIFGGYAPFGLGLVAASGSGIDGFCALVGACFGYLSFQGFAEGLRYAAACILAFSLAFAFFDVKAYRKSWFMPLAAAGMDGITGFVYLSDRGWSPESLIFFGTELLLCGASAYFYRVAFTPWTEKREEEARRVGAFSVYAAILAASLFSLVMAAFMEPILYLLGADEHTMLYAKQYSYCVIVFGGVPTVLSNVRHRLRRRPDRPVERPLQPSAQRRGVKRGGLRHNLRRADKHRARPAFYVRPDAARLRGPRRGRRNLHIELHRLLLLRLCDIQNGEGFRRHIQPKGRNAFAAQHTLDLRRRRSRGADDLSFRP